MSARGLRIFLCFRQLRSTAVLCFLNVSLYSLLPLADIGSVCPASGLLGAGVSSLLENWQCEHAAVL